MNIVADSQIPFSSMMQTEYPDYRQALSKGGETTNYGWDVVNTAPESSIKSAIHYSTTKNLFLT